MEFTLHKYRPNRGLSLLFFTLIVGAFYSPLSAQEEFRINENDRLDLCTGFFTDNGGSEGDHIEGDGVPDTITICSNSTASDATHIRLTFSQFALNGTMQFYNGAEALPENLFNTLDDQSNDQFPVVEASAGNASGCLTVVYTAAADSPGWLALISCEKACQPVRAVLDSSDPVVMPVDTGYIDLCIGEEFTLTGRGIYTESGLIYEQSDAVSSFEWNFDDGSSGTGVSTTHSYAEAGGYTVQLRITDQNDCSNLNQINQRIRVSPKPAYLTQDILPSTVCFGDTFALTGSTQFNPNQGSNVYVTTEQQSFSARQQLSDTTFLPDGSGVVYTTTLEFSNFLAGQTIASPNDLEAICMNMEHSYVGDLDIWIECPNGTIATLVDFDDGTNLTGQFLGLANDDGTLAPGIGFDYCFNNQAEFTWNQAVDVLDIGGAESIPAGDYAPVQSLNALIGCPLNGDWTLNVRDNLSIDNGYIFSWGLQFNDNLFPDLETFNVGFQNAAWEQTSDLVFYSADSIVAAPTAAGTVDYRYSVTDDFGCVTDTTITVEVLPFTHPDCYSCPPLLTSSSQVIDAAPGLMVQTTLADDINLNNTILFRATENEPFGQSIYNNFARAFRSTISVNSVSPDPITSIDQVQSICVNIDAERIGGLRLFVVTPNDQLFELSTGNGGEGSNLTNTCFTPNAITPIQEGEAPFTGDFLPEGNFSNLVGATANGDWTIVAWTVSTGAPLGEFIDWSIEFLNEIPVTYAWAPDDGNLSCTDCPAPIVTAGMENATYTLTVSNSFGCEETGTVTINTNVVVDLDLSATDLTCADDQSGTATVVASDGTEPYTYAWSNEDTTQTISGLAAGVYIVTVTDANGNSQTGSITVNQPAALVLDTAMIVVENVSCNGSADGSVSFSVTGGTGEITYSWSNEGTGTVISNLTAGTYMVTATDANGCSISQEYVVTEPTSLVAELVVTNIACGGTGAGAIDVTVTGGTPDYTYLWSNGATTEDLEDLSAGEYCVTVTDNNGCTIEICGTIAQPADFAVNATITNLLCAGDNSGAIDLEVTGGTGTITFAWSDDANITTQNRAGLAAGEYSVTISDENGCGTTETYTVTEPEMLVIVSAEVQNLSCNGDGSGGINVTITGGTGEYSYLWSDESTDEDRSDLAAGTYSLTVTDANGCTAETTVEVAQPAAITLEFEVADANCNGENDGSINLTVTGGTPPVAFIWSNGAGTEDINLLLAGTYTVSVMDFFGCETTGSATVNEPAALQLSVVAEDVACAGEASGSIDLTIEGGVEPYSVLWSNNAVTEDLIVVTAGNYTATVTDANGCTAQTTVITINEPEAVSCSIEVVAESFNGNDGALAATAAGGVGPYTYLWNNGATTPAISGLAPGTYLLTVTDVNGCTSVCSAELDAYAIVGDKVFFDMNRDGIQNNNEVGINGVAVTITGVDNNFTATTATTNGGTYRFFVLAGSYRLTFGRPNSLEASPQDQGGNDDTDSDINVISLQTATFTVAGLETNLSFDAGFFDPCVPGLQTAGLIADDQELCGPGNQPDLLVEVAAPIIGDADGELNYMWMMTVGDPTLTPITQWTPVPNSNTVNYQPGPLYETTYYARCVRLDECPFLESNIVEIFIGDDASADISGAASTCELETETFVAEGIGNSAIVEWNITGPVNVVSSTANSITLNWGSFGRFQVNLSVTENGCTATNQLEVFVARNCAQNGLADDSDASGNTAGFSTELLKSRVYPNPTTASEARVDLVSGYTYGEPVRLQIYEATGRQISDQQIEGGRRTVQLTSLSGRATGLYIIRLTQGEASETHRVILR